MKFNIEKLDSYSVMPIWHLKDRNLTLKAKGLLSTMYSLPNDWNYTVNGLCKITNTGITSIRNILAELEIKGYMYREETKDEKGRFDYIYHIYFKAKKVKPTENCISLKRFKKYLQHTD